MKHFIETEVLEKTCLVSRYAIKGKEFVTITAFY